MECVIKRYFFLYANLNKVENVSHVAVIMITDFKGFFYVKSNVYINRHRCSFWHTILSCSGCFRLPVDTSPSFCSSRWKMS